MSYYETIGIGFKDYDELDKELNKLPKTYEIVVYRQSRVSNHYRADITFKIHDA